MAAKIKCPGCDADIDPETGSAEFHEPPPGFEPIDDTDDEVATDEGSTEPLDETSEEIPAATDTPAEPSAVEPEAASVSPPPRRKFGWKPRK